MSDLAELVGAGRIDIFEGHRLSPPDLLDIGEMEKEFEAKHLTFSRLAAQGQHPEAAEKILDKALSEIAGGRFSWGSQSFDLEALKAQHLPLWIYVELRHHHPEITREQAGKLLQDHPDPALVQDVVMALAGYTFTKKKSIPDPAVPPTGTPSSTPSESSGSPTATSEGSPSPS